MKSYTKTSLTYTRKSTIVTYKSSYYKQSALIHSFFFILIITPNWAYSHANLNQQLEKISKVIENTSAEDYKKNTALIIGRARLYYRERNYLKAASELNVILSDTPYNLNALYLMAQIEFKKLNLTLAKKFAHEFERLSKNTASKVRAANLLAAIYKNESDFKRAIKYSNFILNNKKTLLPEDVLNAAGIALKLKQNSRIQALAIIDKGIARIGKIHSLVKASIALMIELSHYQQALSSINFLINDSKGLYKAVLMKKKISILDAQSNNKEANITVQKLRYILSSLPQKKKNLPLTASLELFIKERTKTKKNPIWQCFIKQKKIIFETKLVL